MSDNLEEHIENEAETNKANSLGTDTSSSDHMTPFDQAGSPERAQLDDEPEVPRRQISDFMRDHFDRIKDNGITFDYSDEESEDGSYMQNRELSWLAFNERVLDQGADDSVPLLERLNFISIFSSNLQEFFMVRVGSLTELASFDPSIHDSKTGMTTKQQLKAIYKRCRELYPIQESIYEHVRGLLAQQGIRHLRPSDLSSEQSAYLKELVKSNIEPFLSPQIINSRHPFPHLENEKLYILVRLDQKDASDRKKSKKQRGKEKAAKKDKGAEDVLLGLIPLPHQCERVIHLPGAGLSYILLEHAIEMFVPEIFSMYKIKHTNVVRVTRSADIDASEGVDELDDYRDHMRRLLKKRDRLAPVRLECERQLSPVTETLLLKKLKLKRYQTFITQVPLNMTFVKDVVEMIDDKKRITLMYKPFTPAWPICFDRNKPIIDQVSEHDTLMFYPYESMDPFVMLLREAAQDPSVISIKITLYRLAQQSHLAEALIAAAESGKEVCALFELRARFDETNNIEWSQRCERAGCTVLYGFKDLKTHSKICCITRRLPDGKIQHITQLGTGNYNEKTAKLYTDLSYITTNEEFARDAMEFFRNMQLENISDNYDILSVAPLQIKQLILRELDHQIELADEGLPCGAFIKANSLTDKDIIEKISEASQAGVPVTLFIRGICCLIPGVPDHTEEVRVVSLIGRLLEHSRIYCFGQGEESTIYLSSADLMTRNLDKRIEIAWPVLDLELKRRILIYIGVCMHDTAKLRELRPNGTYTPLGAFTGLDKDDNPQPPYDSQAALIEEAALAAKHAARESFQDSVREINSDETSEEDYTYSLYDEPASPDDFTRPYDHDIEQSYEEEDVEELVQDDPLDEEHLLPEEEAILDEIDGLENDTFEEFDEGSDLTMPPFSEDLYTETDFAAPQDREVPSVIEPIGHDQNEMPAFVPAPPPMSIPPSPSVQPYQTGSLSPYQPYDRAQPLSQELPMQSMPYLTGPMPAFQTGQIPPYQTGQLISYQAPQPGMVQPYQAGHIPPYQTGSAITYDQAHAAAYQTGALPLYHHTQGVAYGMPHLSNLPSIRVPDPSLHETAYQSSDHAKSFAQNTIPSQETVVPLIPADQIPAIDLSSFDQDFEPHSDLDSELTDMTINDIITQGITSTAPGHKGQQPLAVSKKPVKHSPASGQSSKMQQDDIESNFFAPRKQEIVMPPQKRGIFKKKDK